MLCATSRKVGRLTPYSCFGRTDRAAWSGGSMHRGASIFICSQLLGSSRISPASDDSAELAGEQGPLKDIHHIIKSGCGGSQPPLPERCSICRSAPGAGMHEAAQMPSPSKVLVFPPALSCRGTIFGSRDATLLSATWGEHRDANLREDLPPLRRQNTSTSRCRPTRFLPKVFRWECGRTRSTSSEAPSTQLRGPDVESRANATCAVVPVGSIHTQASRW